MRGLPMGHLCKKCGRVMPVGREDKNYCMVCNSKLRKDSEVQLKEKGAESREKNCDTPPRPSATGRYPGKHRCATCGHGYKIDNSDIRACNYIMDKEEFKLPPRPRPSAEPNHCLYWASSPSKAGWFTEAEKREIYDKRLKPVIDMKECEVYKSIDTASDLTGVSRGLIKKQCESTEDINAPRRWRYLKPEEVEIFRPSEV